MKILIVDDEEVMRTVTTLFFINICNERSPDCAANGEEAFMLFQRALDEKEPYELVIMDYQMPVMNGYDAVRNMRNCEMNAYGATKSTICVSSACHNCNEIFKEWIGTDKNFCTLPKPINFMHLKTLYSNITQLHDQAA